MNRAQEQALSQLRNRGYTGLEVSECYYPDGRVFVAAPGKLRSEVCLCVNQDGSLVAAVSGDGGGVK